MRLLIAMRQWATNESAILQEVDKTLLYKNFHFFDKDYVPKILDFNLKARDDSFFLTIAMSET